MTLGEMTFLMLSVINDNKILTVRKEKVEEIVSATCTFRPTHPRVFSRYHLEHLKVEMYKTGYQKGGGKGMGEKGWEGE